MDGRGEQGATPEVTVVIAAYNQRWCLENTVASVLHDQGPIRCVIVVDACPFATGDLAREIAEANPGVVEAIELTTNLGQSGARNVGTARVTTPWILYLDGDDLLQPGAIPKLLATARDAQGETTAVVGRFVRTDHGGEVLRFDRRLSSVGQHVVFRKGSFESAPLEIESFLTDFRIGPPGTWLLKTEAVRRLGAFDPSMRSNEDLEFMARVLERGTVVESDEVVLAKRMHPKQQTQDTVLQRWTHLKACWLVLRRSTEESRPAVLRGIHSCFVLRSRVTVAYGSWIAQVPKSLVWRAVAASVAPAGRLELVMRRWRWPSSSLPAAPAEASYVS